MSDEECFALFVDSIEELLDSENQLVTYRWLSQNLSLPVNEAKQILHSYADKVKSSGSAEKLYVTYVIVGIEKDENGCANNKIVLAREKNLEEQKSKFSQISSCHVYSIQRCKLKDPNPLYMCDYDIIKNNIHESNKFSTIKHENIKKRIFNSRKFVEDVETNKENTNSFETNKLKNEKSLVKIENNLENLNSKACPNDLPTKDPTNETQNLDFSKKSKPKLSNNKGTKSTNQSGKLGSMFAAQAKKQANKKDLDNNLDKNDAFQKPAVVKVENNITISKNVEEMNDHPTLKAKTGKPINKKTETSFDSNSEPESEDEIIPPSVQSSSKKGTQKLTAVKAESSVSNSKGKRASNSGQKLEATKKEAMRKRIKACFESSSENESDDEIIPPTPREATPEPFDRPAKSPITSVPETQDNPIVQLQINAEAAPKNRKRKRVDKTFMDDDGFIVTKKVWESGGESETEERPPTPKKPLTVPTKSAATKTAKKASPVKSKQTSMMSFFKKR